MLDASFQSYEFQAYILLLFQSDYLLNERIFNFLVQPPFIVNGFRIYSNEVIKKTGPKNDLQEVI